MNLIFRNLIIETLRRTCAGGRHGLVTATSANLKHRLNKFHKISQNLTEIMTSQGTDAARKKEVKPLPHM